MLSLLPSRTIALSLGQIDITWYGILYLVGFGLAWYLLPRLAKYRELEITKDYRRYILTWALAGVLIGGRLGFVLFYEPARFLADPVQIFFLSQGGMSSHGGFIGVALVLWLVAWSLKMDVWKLADVVVVPVALALALGRVGNWINAELYINNLAHAAAVGKDLVIAGLLFMFLRKTPPNPPLSRGALTFASGRVTALFFILYGVLRFLTEYWRVQDYAYSFGLTRGQLLTLPIIAVGLWLWYARAGKAER